MHVRRRLRATHTYIRRARAETDADFAARAVVIGRNRELLANTGRESPSSHGLSSPRAGACRAVCPRACGLCMYVSRMRAPDGSIVRVCLWLHIGIVAALSARGNYSPLMLGLPPQTQTVDDILLQFEKVFACMCVLARDQCRILCGGLCLCSAVVLSVGG